MMCPRCDGDGADALGDECPSCEGTGDVVPVPPMRTKAQREEILAALVPPHPRHL